MFTTRTFCVCVSKPNLSCQFPSQSPFLWAFADTVHQNEKLIMSSSFLNILPEIQFFKNPFIFDWRIIALQYCVGFCHTATWISHGYPYVPGSLKSKHCVTSTPGADLSPQGVSLFLLWLHGLLDLSCLTRDWTLGHCSESTWS